jgi:hypothetical protein
LLFSLFYSDYTQIKSCRKTASTNVLLFMINLLTLHWYLK